jgi:hypothetical protein
MIVSQGSLLAIRHCSIMRAYTRITPLCYIDQPVTYQGKPLFMGANDVIQPSLVCPGPGANTQHQRNLQRTEIGKSISRNLGRRKNKQPHRKNLLRWHQHLCRHRPILRTPPKAGAATIHHTTKIRHHRKNKSRHEGRRRVAPCPRRPSRVRRSPIRTHSPNTRSPSLRDRPSHRHRMSDFPSLICIKLRGESEKKG